PGEWNCPDFMPKVSESSKKEDTRVGTGKPNVVCCEDLYVVVCVTLVTGKERANFEPGGVLGAGRINPMILVMSSEALAGLKGRVTLARPGDAGCCAHHCEKEDEVGRSL